MAGLHLLVAALALTGGGCSTKPPTVPKEVTDRKAEDPWPRAVLDLRRDTDLAACRRVLEQLRGDLVTNVEPRFQPAGLAPEQEKAVQALLNLTEPERREIRSASFSSLDPRYLAECYYLRDAARSLGLAGLPPARQAQLAFDWVTRQLVLQPWVTTLNGQRQVMPPAPPSLALQRGAASGLERAYVFLGLLQQLGLDGCLVGPPEASTRNWAYSADPKSEAPARGPFWAVGVRVGPDVLLFDPWRGESVPGPAGVATLAQVKADANLLKGWREDKARPWTVAPADVTTAVPFLTPPLNALAPRFVRLETELRNELPPIRLAVAAEGMLARFRGEAKSPGATFWNPPGEPFTPTRSLASYTLSQDGGYAPSPELPGKFLADMLPVDLFGIPDALKPLPGVAGDAGVPEAVERIRLAAINTYGASYLTPPTPRERIQRGQHAEATPALVRSRGQFLAGQERLRTDRGREEVIARWAAAARGLYTTLLRARDKQGAESAAFTNAQLEVENFWKKETDTVTALIDLAVSEPGLAESTYLLALCWHEQAEQAFQAYDRLRADPKQAGAAGRARDKAAAAWAEARGWWQRYEPFAERQDLAFPGRADHARRLAESAQRRAAELPGRSGAE